MINSLTRPIAYTVCCCIDHHSYKSDEFSYSVITLIMRYVSECIIAEIYLQWCVICVRVTGLSELVNDVYMKKIQCK